MLNLCAYTARGLDMPKSKKEAMLGAIEGFSSALDIPAGTLTKGAQIVLSSNREATIEGCKGVLEYSGDKIRLSTGNSIIRFSGSELEIKSLSPGHAAIKGFIVSIEFEN